MYDKELIIFSIIICLITGISILVFNHLNEYKRIERWFYYYNKYYYILVNLCYYLLLISFIFNARYIVYSLIAYIMHKKFNIKMSI
jgi:hypothetical protein